MSTFHAPENTLKDRFAEYRRNIPNASDMPAYKLLQHVIQMGIARGDWLPGQLIPPEHVFAKHIGVSIGTVKRAMLNMVNEGLLYRRQGSGTYVAAPSFTRQLRRYYLFLEHFNDTESANHVGLHSVQVVPSNPEINSLLKLADCEQLIKIVRTFREGNEVIVLSKSYFSACTFAGLESVVQQRFENVPLFLIVEEDYGMPTAHSEELIGVEYPTAEEAILLQSTPETAVLALKTLNFTSGNTPFEYRESLCRSGKKFMYRSIEY